MNLVYKTVFFLLLLCGLYSCTTVSENKRYPNSTTTNCLRTTNELIDSFQSYLSLKKAAKVTIPGQATFGRPRVDYLRYRFQNESFEEIQEYLATKPIPYIENPDGKWVPHDRHHLFLALIKEQENLKKRFPKKSLQITFHRKESFLGRSWPEYRSYMEENNLVLLKFKGEVITWEELPQGFQQMKKDFFRGMAYIIIKAGYVEKETVPFFEFLWADHLRRRFPNLNPQWNLQNIEIVFQDLIENPRSYRNLPGLSSTPPSLEEGFSQIQKISDALNW